MIGAILLIIAILLYFNPRRRYMSYFLYLSFMMEGMNLWTDSITGIKDMDLAIIYTFIISAYLVLTGQWKIPKWPIRKFYVALIIMIGVCVCFSYFHYGLSPIQILQGGRSFLLILSFPILLRVKYPELRKILKILFFFCVITSILYILQIILRTPIMPYGEFGIDSSTGLPRFYNIPYNLDFFLALSFLMPKYFKHNIWGLRILLFLALVCTLGRTFIISTIALVLLSMLMQGKFKRIGVTITILFLLMVPFYGVVSDRFEGAGGSSDFTDIANGNYRSYRDGRDGGTMVYRFAWIYERWSYMKERPISELLLGLGLVSEQQPWIYQHYNFSLGLINQDTGLLSQLGTPDISYGNLLTRLGLLGSIVYIIFAISLTVFLFKNRKVNTFVLLTAAQMITIFLVSFSGTTLSETRNFALIFIIMSFLYNQNKKGTQEIGL